VEKIKLGLSVPAALRGMARRVDLPDFNIFVTAVTLHRTVGGNLTHLLDRVATSTRDRNTFRGYVRAATALSRITGFAIAAAAPLLFFGYLFWQPNFIATFTQSQAGMRALWIALGLELIGAAWMYYLLRIDY
jgi:tight adherence protein B